MECTTSQVQPSQDATKRKARIKIPGRRNQEEVNKHQGECKFQPTKVRSLRGYASLRSLDVLAANATCSVAQSNKKTRVKDVLGDGSEHILWDYLGTKAYKRLIEAPSLGPNRLFNPMYQSPYWFYSTKTSKQQQI